MFSSSTWYRPIVSLVVASLLFSMWPAPVWATLSPVGEPYTTETIAANTTDPLGPAAAVPAADRAPAPLGPNAPDAIAAPLSVARVQSAYTPSGVVDQTVVVTFTVANNLPPALIPEVPTNATVTETVDILLDFDYAADPNTIRNVILTDAFPGLAVTTPADAAAVNGDALALNVGDVPPATTVTAAVRVDVSALAGAPGVLDTGAAADGTWRGRPVAATAAPVALLDDSFAGWLIDTPDADLDDRFMLAQLGALPNDPAALFAFVRAFDYEAYTGSLRGTRATLWSEAGNSVDQSNLLIAMLRASGVPARYVRGTLDTPTAQTLIASMFPPLPRQLGALAPSADISDPVNDAALLADVADHWWVEAYFDGSWQALDPSFPTAAVGDTFAAPAATYAEVPDADRHKITLRLTAEFYNAFAGVFSNFPRETPLEATYRTVDLAGRPINLYFNTESDGAQGVFTEITHDYVPVLAIGEGSQLVVGDAFQDLFSNFAGPLSQRFVTGLWLDVESIAPDGTTELYTRTIRDLIGAGPRLGAYPDIIAIDEERGDPAVPLLSPVDLTQIEAITFSAAPDSYLEELRSLLLRRARRLAEIDARASALPEDSPELEQIAVEEGPFFYGYGQVLTAFRTAEIMARVRANDPSGRLQALVYPARPLLTLQTNQFSEDTFARSFEFLNTRQRTIAYPGQATAAAFAASSLASLNFKLTEYDYMVEKYGAAESGVRTLLEATAAGIPLTVINAASLDVLEALPLDERAKGIMYARALEGRQIVVPAEMVLVDGEPTIGWLEIEDDGHTMVADAAGRYAAALVEYMEWDQYIAIVIIKSLRWIGIQIAKQYIKEIVLELLRAGVGFAPQLAAVDTSLVEAAAFGTSQALAACSGIPSRSCATLTAVEAGLSTAQAAVAASRPLPPTLLSPAVEPAAADAANTVAATATVPGNSLVLNAATSSATAVGPLAAAWPHAADRSTLRFNALTAASATIYDEQGTLLDSGAVDVTAQGNIVAVTGAPAIAVSGTGSLGFAPPAVSGVAGGTQWLTDTVVTLSGTAPYTLTVSDLFAVVDDGPVYSGTLDLVISGSATLAVDGAAAAPAFNSGVPVTPTLGGLMVGPATGTFTVNGAPVDLSQGVAIGGLSSPLTVAEASATTDQVSLTASADFFKLTTAPAGSAVAPGGSAAFAVTIDANFDDTYLVDIFTPDGWSADLDTAGNATVTAPRNATPDTYTVLVTAQSTTYPNLFVSAEHTVTTTPSGGLALAVAPDPAISVPVGTPRVPGNDYLTAGVEPFGQPNDGRGQLADLAYTVLVTNTATFSREFSLEVANAPAGWLSLSSAPAGATGTTLALAAGETGAVGLYLRPTGGTVPAPGATYNLDVTATAIDDGAVTDSATINIVVPSAPFPFLTLDPLIRYTGPDSLIALQLDVENVGNDAGAFDVDIQIDGNLYSGAVAVTDTLTAVPDSVTTPLLAVGGIHSDTLTVATTGTVPGQAYLVTASSAGAGYTPRTYASIVIVSAAAACAYDAAALIDSLDDPLVAAYLNQLGAAIDAFAADLTDLDARDAVIDAIDLVAQAADELPSADAMRAVAASLAGHTDPVDLQSDLDALCVALAGLADDAVAYDQFDPAVAWDPSFSAVLLGDTAALSLTVTNQGTLSATYAITAALPDGDQTAQVTLDPGESADLPFNTTPAATGLFPIAADVRAIGTVVQRTANAGLNVVDAFLAFTDVDLDPTFVDSGSSSTSVAIDVDNLALVPLDASALIAFSPIAAETVSNTITSTVALSATVDVTLFGGAQSYALGVFDTSPLETGVYTVAVTLRDPLGNIIPVGTNYDYLFVGQSLGIEHAVAPVTVPPGTVTVTTVITSEILVDTIIDTSSVAPLPAATGARAYTVVPDVSFTGLPDGVDTAGAPASAASGVPDAAAVPGVRITDPYFADPVAAEPATAEPAADTSREIGRTSPAADDAAPDDLPMPQLAAFTGYSRTEASETTVIDYSAGWFSRGVTGATEGNTYRSETPGASATFTFTGTWANVGLFGNTDTGLADIYLDGALVTTVDTYRKQGRPLDVVLNGLPDATHTLSVTVVGAANPFATNDFVYLDFIDAWDGTPLPTGVFEQEDDGPLYTNVWEFRNDPDASGGRYARSTGGTFWFPFEGDSISLDVFKFNGAAAGDIYVDGEFLHRLDLYAPFDITETVTLDGFGPGLHLLTLRPRQDYVTVDRILVPGGGPAYADPVQTGIIRVEEFDRDIQYNGVPFTATATSWSFTGFGRASRGDTALSAAPGDTVTFNTSGDWLSVGLMGNFRGGRVAIAVDGVVVDTVDTYRRVDRVVNPVFTGLGAGAHTVTLTLLPDSNPFSDGTRLYFDYAEWWDGAAEPDGTFNADFSDIDRFRYSDGWSLRTEPDAADNDYIRSTNSTAWFHFTGDSMTYEGFAYSGGDLVNLYLDGLKITTLDLYSAVDISRTVTFDNLIPGPHVITVESERGNATLDRFHVPAIEPATALPTCSGYCRYEENDPALRFNGAPADTAPTTFSNQLALPASDAYVMRSATPGDAFSLEFSGDTALVGLFTSRFGGEADIYLDGAYVETVDTYTRDDGTVTARLGGLSAGTHVISVTVTGNAHPFSGGSRVELDYIDVWDGTALPAGPREAEDAAYTSNNWFTDFEPVATNGSFLATTTGNRSIWLPFTGDSVELALVKWTGGDRYARILVDGVEIERRSLWAATYVTETIAYDGFGPGAHVLQIQSEFNGIGVDTFQAPATVAPTPIPPPTGLVRYEEDALTYNGVRYAQRPASWFIPSTIGAAPSAQRVIASTTVDDVIALDFYGSAFNVGLYNSSGTGVAEVFLDGVSLGLVDTTGSADLYTIARFGDFITDTHTLSITVVSGRVAVDYIDVWDGSPIADELIDPWPADQYVEPRVHWGEFLGFYGTFDDNAIGDRYVTGWFNANHRVWHTFVGDSVTFYGFTRNNVDEANIYIDGVLAASVDMRYDFSPVPIAFHFNDLGPGMHEIRVDNGLSMRVDGFETPATNVPYGPVVEWYDTAPAGNDAPFFGSIGMVSGIATGDINNDGVNELVLGSDTLLIWGKLFVYRADGGDTGDGDPILWTDDIGGAPTARALIGTPAIGDLDADPEGEIVVFSTKDLRVYEHDGAIKWITDTYKSPDVTGAPALGNLDLDPEPEIVVNYDSGLAVFEPDGTLAWSTPFPYWATAPMLADLNGDGILDIVSADWGSVFDDQPTHVYAYSYNFGSPTLLWTQTLTPSIAAPQSATFENGLLGSHAIADIDGDDLPEILMSHYGWITALNHDGTILWQTELEPGFPGGVSIADIDGDAEVEIITGMKHEFEPGRFGKLYALNADGSLLWDVVAEDSTSANNAAVLDLNGDGIFEVAWNGKQQGFTIYNGADGSIIYNEPLAYTISGSDYPIIVDADGDGNAEIIAPTLRGPVVFGMDGAWTNARPIWNQQTYHITNVNDDLSIPFSELDSWAVHNTYHTQYPDGVVLPIYDVTVTHTVGITDVTVLTDTFNIDPGVSDDPAYRWDYVQTYAERVVTRTFDTRLDNLLPGENRLLAQSTVVDYTLPSGTNRLTLPPLYVTVAHIIGIAPEQLIVSPGGQVTYTVTLTNAASSAALFDLSVTGLPSGWVVDWPTSVVVPANSTLDVPFVVAAGAGAADGALPFAVQATINGAVDTAAATLIVRDTFDMALAPAARTTALGVPATYTLTVTNRLTVPQTIDLSGAFAGSLDVVGSVLLPPSGAVTTPVTVSVALPGGYTPTVSGVSAAEGTTDSATAALTVVGARALAVDIAPSLVSGGAESPLVYTVTVSNLGTVSETAGLSVDVPAGWSAELRQNGALVSAVTLNPGAFNAAELALFVTAPAGTALGGYPVTVTATADPQVTASDSATAFIDPLGVGVEFAPAVRTTNLSPTETGQFQVIVTNHGTVADTYDLSAIGFFAVSGVTFAPASVALAPGESAPVSVTTAPVPWALPQAYELTVVATSQTDSRVSDIARETVIFDAVFGVDIAWIVDEITVPTVQPVSFSLRITNTGNTTTDFALTGAFGTLLASLPPGTLTLPAGASVVLPLPVTPVTIGAFPFTVTATGAGGVQADVSDSADALLIVLGPLAVSGQSVTAQPAVLPLLSWLLLLLLAGATWVLWRRRYMGVARGE